MNLNTLALASARYYWRTNLAVVLGVAAAVSVLAGALVVGDSVRGSLRDLALGRLGRTDAVISSLGFFREAAADDARGPLGAAATAPMIVADGFVTLESSGRRAANVFVYGVDERFWRFHGRDPVDGVFVSPALAAEIGGVEGDVLLTRLQRPSEIPVESLFGRKEDVGRTVRLTLAGVLPRDRLGEFALRPQQTGVRAVFAPLRRIQRDLGVQGQVNTILVNGGNAGAAALQTAWPLDDLGVRVRPIDAPAAVAVEHASGIVSDALERAVRVAAEKLALQPQPIFTYLANRITNGDRAIPYSLVTAIDEELTAGAAAGKDTIVLNQWAAKELAASPGDSIAIEYYRWDPTAGLTTHTAAFTVGGVVPIAGLAADRTLAPDYPGITQSKSLADWDPPFPIDLARVRPVDEAYWDAYRATPKAFIGYERGRDAWQSRYGRATSIRLRLEGGRSAAEVVAAVEGALRASLSPAAMGITLVPVRAAALDAARGATDFGEYFAYFSFFLVVSALLLAVLFFKLGVEQRLRQAGILRAAGYPMATIRRLLLSEAIVLAVVGGVVGAAGAVAYGRVILYGLRTWWVGAVNTTALTLHLQPGTLAIGVAGGVIAAVACVFVSLRAVGRLSPRALLSAQSLDASGGASAADVRRARRNRILAGIAAILAIALLAAAVRVPSIQAGAFFGAGAALLVAALLGLSAWLRARDARPIAGHGTWAVARLGFRSAAHRPSRSVLSAALIAAAAFIIVSVDAFRRGGGELTADPTSGIGGYTLYAESEVPLLQDPNTPTGREALLLQAPEMATAQFTRFRVRAGEDASCLNLYRPTNPTIIAPAPGFIESGRFTFAGAVDGTAADTNPWTLLRRDFGDGTVPVIADATSMQYVLHVKLGETMTIDIGAAQPLVLRFVGALRDSVLQGELIMAEEHFTRLFPMIQGYRAFLIQFPGVTAVDEANRLAGVVEQELQPFGVDATVTSERLASFHTVENTYLSTFQALGGLGLLLGTIGLATVMFRNVLERRRELALLRAVGFDAGRVSTMILAESMLVLVVGLLAGGGSALLAIAPAWLGRGGGTAGMGPGAGLIGLLAAVAAAGLLSSLVATRAALHGRVLDGLRTE